MPAQQTKNGMLSMQQYFRSTYNQHTLQYKQPKEWELIPEYWQNICLWVSVSVPVQITLGVLFIMVQVSSLLGYFGKFDYFVLPQEFSHILCAHNLFLPAW